MAFIEKKDPVVLNIKLTSKGREQLSKGLLTFSYFAVGDSEIDYEFNNVAQFNPFYSNILRPADKNPQQLSFIPRDLSGDSYNVIDNVPCTPTIIENQVPPIGFFEANAITFLTDTDHVKQPDAMVIISGVTGGTTLTLVKAPTYLANVNEPAVGDLLLVKWTNPDYVSGDTTGYTVNTSFPTPYLFYNIQAISGGTLAGDNLIVEVDRELPNFSGSSSNHAGAMIFYNYINYTGDTCYSTDETDDALIAFLQNCQCPTITFPFWNMSIIFTENIAGVQLSDKQFGDYSTKGFGGFVSYIQNQAPVYKKLGVIHYTNPSVANTYAEGFYGDPLNVVDVDKLPTLDIPIIMWHKSSGTTLGVKLKASGGVKYLTGVTKSLNTKYFDLADPSGNVVGKVFYTLKIFVIEDQELLFAMSYKSNRSWTLPSYGVDINANVTFGCPDCVLTYGLSGTSPTFLGASDGTITVHDIIDNLGSFNLDQILLEVLSGGTGGTQIYFDSITGDTTISDLSAAEYITRVYDVASTNCIVESGITITNPYSDLSITGGTTGTTGNLIVGYFLTEAHNNNPSWIRIAQDVIAPLGFGGTGYTTIATTGTSVDSRTINTTDVLNNWIEVPNGGYVETMALSLTQPYTIYVRDIWTGDTLITDARVVSAQTWAFHVAVATPFVSDPSTVSTIVGSDGGGTYVTISNYLTTINPSINPIVGNIEMSVHQVGDPAFVWQPTANDGSSTKLYHNLTGAVEVSIREKFGYISVYEITTSSFTP